MKFIKDAASNTACVYLDLEDTKLPNLGFDVEPLLHFNISTYANLKPSNDDSAFDATFKFPNMFLQTLTEEQRTLFAANIIVMHNDIICTLNSMNINLDDPFAVNRNNSIMYDLEDRLAKLIVAVDDENQLDLYNKMLEFSNIHVSLAEQPNLGERPQDSTEKTLWTSELRIIAALFMMCKLFTVIVGTFIERCKDLNMDKSIIETHCMSIFKYILRKDDTRIYIYDKLYSYISDTIVRVITDPKDYKEAEANYLYNGNTPETITDKAVAQLFTRKAITVDLSTPNTNLGAYIHNVAKNIAHNGGNSNSTKISVRYRSAPNENPYADSEEGNDSILEVESANTICTADVNSIISFAVDDVVKRYIHAYCLNESIVNKVISYYTDVNHISLTPINSYLLCILFGNDLMGSKSIELLTGKDLAKLTAVMQLYFIEHGYMDLVHLVSLSTKGGLKASLTGSESKLKSAFMNNKAYRLCADRFKFELDDVKWNTSLEATIKAVTTYKYVVNTAFAVWAILDQDPMNGYEYIAPDTLGESICRLILECTEHEGN